MAATFNLLRGTELIWNTVISHLPARRGLPGVRPAALERRRHQPAGAGGTRPTCATAIATTSWSCPMR
jgi:hypothetical protein